jgi:hypothetical protein
MAIDRFAVSPIAQSLSGKLQIAGFEISQTLSDQFAAYATHCGIVTVGIHVPRGNLSLLFI